MKVLYIYRSKELNLFSIEKHFHLIEKHLSNIEIRRVYLPYGRVTIKNIVRNLLFLKKYITKERFDIYHVTGHVNYATLVLPKKRTLLTVHDLGGIEMYKGIKKILFKVLFAYLPFKKCSVIASISEKTKDEILSIDRKAEKKIIIAPAPIEDGIELNKKNKCNNPKKILMIGTAENKNHVRCIQALKESDYVLSIVGKMLPEEIDALNKNSINYENYINVSDEMMRDLYLSHDLVLFASTYEGFGAIIIEAQKYGCPVVTSNIEPMCSVAGGAAVLVDPYDINDIRNKIDLVVNDSEYAQGLVDAGYTNARKYFASNLAKKYISVYENMISKL